MLEKLLERFWQANLDHFLSPIAAKLYMFLLYEAQKNDWQGPVECSWSRIQMWLDVSSRQQISTAILELKEAGLITYEAEQHHKNKPSRFWFPDLVQNVVQNVVQNEVQNVVQNVVHIENQKMDHKMDQKLDHKFSHNYAENENEVQNVVHIENHILDQIKERKEKREKVSPYNPLLKERREKKENNNINNITSSLTGGSVFANSANTPTPLSETSPKADRTPYKEIVELYHKYCPSLPRVKVLTDTRKKYIRARWKEHPDLKFWEEFFKRVEVSDFLTGRADYGNRRPFMADLEWLMRPNNFAKVLEGRYDNRDPVDPAQEEMLQKLQKIILEGG